MSGGTNKALAEFLSEAQEFVESLSRNLMDIDKALKTGEPDPDMVNEVFRGWHTLKGLSSTFGVPALSQLAHDEENLLDDIRLGRKTLTPRILDSLLESVEEVMLILSAIDEAGDLSVADQMVRRRKSRTSVLAGATPGRDHGGGAEPMEADPAKMVPAEVLEVLTEFEEHRLRTNIQNGRALYKIRTRFSLMSIDSELESIKGRLKPIGEIITYLPSAESTDPEMLDIDVLLSLHGNTEELEAALDGVMAEIDLLVPSRSPVDMSETPSGNWVSVPPPPQVPEDRRTSIPGPPDEVQRAAAQADKAIVSRDKDQGISLRSVSQSVRVDIGKLDRLMNVVGELNIVRSAIAKVSDELRSSEGRRDLAIELHRVLRGFERRLAEMREGILEVRMVPVGQMFDRLARTTRKVSRNLEKEIHLVVSGADTEVDKLIIEELSDPLMHIIRNSIDHGIEDPAERRAAGKPEVGTVALTAYQKGNHVLIDVEDDGAGIDTDSLIEAAVGNGHITSEQAEALSEREIINLIFLPGLTTSKETTEVSGRGVGMDVVKTNISALGGIIEVESELGIGTKITITMPVTLAIIPALLVSVDSQTFAVALNTVAEALMISSTDVRSVMGNETMTLRGQTLPLCRLDAFFGVPRGGEIPPDSRVVVASLGQRRLGLVVDSLVGQQDVVIKPLGNTLADADVFAGATDIGDQKLTLVIDTAAVIEEFFASGEDGIIAAATVEQ